MVNPQPTPLPPCKITQVRVSPVTECVFVHNKANFLLFIQKKFYNVIKIPEQQIKRLQLLCRKGLYDFFGLQSTPTSAVCCAVGVPPVGAVVFVFLSCVCLSVCHSDRSAAGVFLPGCGLGGGLTLAVLSSST